MSFGSKPMGAPPPARPRPPARTDAAFAIGSRALVTATRPGTRDVPLTNEDGVPIEGHLPVDANVIITAWRPRRAAPPRYRVCADRAATRIEGWVDAANLRRLPPPPPPAPMAMPVPVATPKPPPSRPAARSRTPAPVPTTPPRKTAKPAAKKPAPAPPAKAKASRPVRKRAR